MKYVQLFYLKHCPYCRKTQQDLEELLQNPKYGGVQIEWIEESMEAEKASQYDYYYVPCFYVDGVKIKEGVLNRLDVQEVLNLAIE